MIMVALNLGISSSLVGLASSMFLTPAQEKWKRVHLANPISQIYLVSLYLKSNGNNTECHVQLIKWFFDSLSTL